KKDNDTNTAARCLCCEKMPRVCRRCLRNYDPSELKSAPRSHAHATNFQCGAEASAQFLLNLCLCALRLHIEIHSKQESSGKRNHGGESNQRNPTQFSHSKTLPRGSLKKRPKPWVTFPA